MATLPRPLVARAALVSFGCFLSLLSAWAQPVPASAPGGASQTYTLTLSETVQRVLERNAKVQERLLDYAVSQRRARAEHGIFEPEAFGSGSHESNNRQNSSEQAAQANGVSILQEVNNLYQGGVDFLVPTGAKVQAGYTLSDINNNIPPSIFASPITTGQYETFAGVSVTQPLLKNFGTAATMAQIRIAALSSKIAFQDYRRELMTEVATAESTYWALYLAQQQVGFFEDSVKLAEKILATNRTKAQAGVGSDLDVLEAQAGLGLRRAKLIEARQKALETSDRLIALFAESASERSARIVLTDVPTLPSDASSSADQRQRALAMNPDYLIQGEKADQEQVRLRYAKNQRLFEVNLKGAYGLNGFGDTPYQSIDYVTHAGYASWSFGMELKIPLFGGVKGRNDLAAARLQLTSAQVSQDALATEIANGLDTAGQKLARARASVDSYQDALTYSQNLFDSALVRLEAGKIDSQKLLEIESELFDAKNSVVESLIRYKVARLEVSLIEGTILEERNLEITQAQLQKATDELAKNRKWGRDAYALALQHVHGLYPAEGGTKP